MDLTDNKQVINAMNNIIVNDTDFIGASGHVKFDENGMN